MPEVETEMKSYPDIPRSILAALLDCDGSAGDMSPRHLMGDATSVTRHQLAELYAGGFIDLPNDSKVILAPSFKNVADVLRNPATSVTCRLWGADNVCGESSLLFPADIADGEGVVLNQIGQFYRIAAPAQTSDLLDLLRPVIPPDGHTEYVFEGHFDVPVAAVLFALIDLFRQERRSSFDEGRIYGYLAGQWGLTDFDRLITYIAVAGILPQPPPLQEVNFALHILLYADIIYKNKKGQYSLTDRLIPLAEGFADMIPGLQWQRVSKGNAGELLCSNRIFILGEDGIILSFAPTVKGRLLIATVTRREMIDFLLDEFMMTLSLAKMENHSPAVKMNLSCKQCGNTVAPNKKFCTKCGASMVREPDNKPIVRKISCTSCGEQIDYKKKFCTHCGASTGRKIRP